jgi:hypothetical protein
MGIADVELCDEEADAVPSDRIADAGLKMEMRRRLCARGRDTGVWKKGDAQIRNEECERGSGYSGGKNFNAETTKKEAPSHFHHQTSIHFVDRKVFLNTTQNKSYLYFGDRIFDTAKSGSNLIYIARSPNALIFKKQILQAASSNLVLTMSFEFRQN